MPSDLVGIGEIARHYDVTPQAIDNWIKRNEDFPAPVTRLRATPVYLLSQVVAWRESRPARVNAEPGA
jgi:hypothetical protein